MPTTQPVVLETRKLMDGDRYLVVLAESGGGRDTSQVLSVVSGENGAWYIDEAGSMTQPEIDAAGTPIVDQEAISARATEYAATPATSRFPSAHHLDCRSRDRQRQSASLRFSRRHADSVFQWRSVATRAMGL